MRGGFMKQQINRREFLKSTSTGVVGIGMASDAVSSSEVYGAAVKSEVVVVRNDKAISDRNVCDKKQAALMVDKALLTLTGKMNAKEAWLSLGVTKEDVVGIKVNCNTADFRLYAHPGLVYSLCDSLSSIVSPNNIIIYERYTGELTRAGFRENKGNAGVRCFGTDQGGGFHPKEVLTRIITDMCTKIINVPSLKASGPEIVGSLFLKNHIGSLPPSEMPRCHGNTDFITNVCSQASIRNKTVLAMCDGLRGTYTSTSPWYWGGIIMSRDQVAAEYTAIQAISNKLLAMKKSPLIVPPYVMLAETAYKLGTCNPGKINLKRIVM